MLKTYNTALVDHNGSPVYGPHPIPATNPAHAAEQAYASYSFPHVDGTTLAVQIPETNTAINFEVGTVN